MKRAALIILFVVMTVSASLGADDPLESLRQETLSFFKPVTARVERVEAGTVFMSGASGDVVKPGMRLRVLREGMPFVHPVTKEVIGKVETTVGTVEVKDVETGGFSGILVAGEAKPGDAVRLSGAKIRVLFCQDAGVDWYLADEYYRRLKASGRLDLADTALQTGDGPKIVEEARRLNAEVALSLTVGKDGNGVVLQERLFWASDGRQFFQSDARIGGEYVKELKFGQEFFSPGSGEALMIFNLPFNARYIVAGDFDGSGRTEVALSTGTDIRVYLPGADLELLWEIKGSSTDDHIWLDALDLDKDGRDEIVVTSRRSDEVLSSVYAFSGEGFHQVWKGKYFLRKVDGGLAGQEYSASEGFSGDVFRMSWNGGLERGETVPLPKGVNLYDFVLLGGEEDGPLVMAYDEDGFLNLYDKNGGRIWRSASGNGGPLMTFKKQASNPIIGAGEWAVEGRLVRRQLEILAVQRVPFVEMMKGVGFKSSRIRSYWWNGLSMEDSVLIDDIKGTLLDYVVMNDNIYVLTSPFLGLKLGNILKGENPLGASLFVYSVKGG